MNINAANQTPVHVFLQVVDDFDAPVGDQIEAHPDLRHAQLTDHLNFLNWADVQGWEKWPSGAFVVVNREFRPRRYPTHNVPHYELSLVISIRQV